MKSLISCCLIATLLYSVSALAAQDAKPSTEAKVSAGDVQKEQYLTCSGYYFVLSIPPDHELVPDLNHDQAIKASFAMMKKVVPDISTPEAQSLLADKTMELRKEIPGPMKQDGVNAFRKKYDGVCRALLKQAWCDAYREFDQKACAG